MLPIRVTRELANELLVVNYDNRNEKPGAIQKYAFDMANGFWKHRGPGVLTLEVPSSTPEGEETTHVKKLQDGQNRLQAVIQSGVDFVDFWVLFTDDPDMAKVAVDTGAVRTFTNVLQIDKMPNPGVMSATTKLIYATLRNPFFVPFNTGDGRFPGAAPGSPIPRFIGASQSQLIKLYEENRDALVESAKRATVMGKKYPLKHFRTSSLALADFEFSAVDTTKASNFWGFVLSPNSVDENHPCAKLHKLLGVRLDNGEPRYPQRTEIAYLRKVWKAFYNNQPLGQLKYEPGSIYKPGERFPGVAGRDEKS